jgi:excisionase family DNA binding protein
MSHNNTPRTPRLITAKEAANILSIQKSTFYDWLARGYLPCHRMSRVIRVDKADLDEFLANTRRNEFLRTAADALGEIPIAELTGTQTRSSETP